MANVLLIDPPLHKDPVWDPIRYAQPLGLWSIASHLRRYGHEAHILSVPTEAWNDRWLVEPDGKSVSFDSVEQFKWRSLNGSKEVRNRLDRFVARQAAHVYIGMDHQGVIQAIQRYDPDIIGISLIASCHHQSVIDLARAIRAAGCDLPIVVGGQHATAMPEVVLRDGKGAIDWLVRGEAEQIMLAIADSPRDSDTIRRLPGLAYLDDADQIQKNRRARFFSLDDVALPDAAILDQISMPVVPPHTLDTGGRKYADIMFSVGCHNTCAYCYSPQMRGGLRQYSEKQIRGVLEDLWAHGYRELILQDDDLLYNRVGFMRLLELIKEHGFSWQDNGGIELELLDEELIDAIADSGCTGLYVPVNPRKIADRFPQADALLKVHLLGRLKAHGIYTYTSGIYGVPNLEHPDRALDDIRSLRDFHVDLISRGYADASLVFPLSGLPGTKWFFEMRRHPEFAFERTNWLSYSIFVPQIWPRSIGRARFEHELLEVHRQLNEVQTSLPWFSPFPNHWARSRLRAVR